MTMDRLSGDNRLHLMVQTPTALFVYWEMTEVYLDLARSALQGVLPGIWIYLLRVGEKGVETVASQFIPDLPVRGSFYFTGQKPYSKCFAELTLAYRDSFFTLLRSGTILLPPDSKAEQKLDAAVTWPELITSALPFAYSPTENQSGRGE